MSDDLTPKEKKLAYENNKLQAERTFDQHNKFIDHLNQATIDSGMLAIRSALLINGGAAIATLAYVGKLDIKDAASVIESISWFAWGVAIAAIGTASAYMANFSQVREETSKEKTWKHPYILSTKISKRWLYCMNIFISSAILAGAASIILFIFGMYDVKDTISSLDTITKKLPI